MLVKKPDFNQKKLFYDAKSAESWFFILISLVLVYKPALSIDFFLDKSLK